jgi:hypothetical protein
MSTARPGFQMAWPDAMLQIVKALPHCYRPPAELPQHILMLLDQMEQKPVVQRQQQPQPKKG